MRRAAVSFIAAAALALFIAGEGDAQTASAEAEAAAALAALDPEATSPDQLRPLILALTRAEEAGAAPAPVLIAGWTEVLERLAAGERWHDAEIAADRAIGLLGMLEQPPLDLRLAAAQAGARSALNNGRYDVAAWRYAWGAAGVPPVSAESGAVDPVWADLMTRAAAARAAHRSLPSDDDLPPMPAVAAPQDVAQPPCRPDWTRTREARLPRRILERARPGAALAEITISPEGEVAALEILMIAPQQPNEVMQAAEEAVRDAAARWRADPATLSDCDGVRYVAAFEFVREFR